MFIDEICEKLGLPEWGLGEGQKVHFLHLWYIHSC